MPSLSALHWTSLALIPAGLAGILAGLILLPAARAELTEALDLLRAAAFSLSQSGGLEGVACLLTGLAFLGGAVLLASLGLKSRF